MKQTVFCFFLIFITIKVTSQDLSAIDSNPSANIINEFSGFNLSSLFENNYGSYDGVIGAKYQRIRVYFDSIIKSDDDGFTYFVFGRTKVKENVCDFKGVIVFYYANKDASFNYENETNEIDGILKANYVFRENPDQKSTGLFKGELISYWTLKEGNVSLGTGGYTSIDYGFAFEGSWQGYKSDNISKCCWSNYRIPCAPDDFDMSDGPDVIPNIKYKNAGWGNLNVIYNSHPDSEEFKDASRAEKIESNWWKE